MTALKTRIKYLLQSILGYERYLFTFARFKINTLKWDSNERDFFTFLKLLPKESTVLDIGANIGIMSVHLARKCQSVKAFEPVPQNVKALKKVIDHYGLLNVEVYDFALGSDRDEIEMIVPVVDDVKMQGLSHVNHESITDFTEGEKITTQQFRLDDLTELKNERVSGIKLDVENFEYFVLKGGEELLKQHLPIIYTELWENENRKKCFDLLKNLGYTCYVVVENKTVPFNPDFHHTQNFIFSTKTL